MTVMPRAGAQEKSSIVRNAMSPGIASPRSASAEWTASVRRPVRQTIASVGARRSSSAATASVTCSSPSTLITACAGSGKPASASPRRSPSVRPSWEGRVPEAITPADRRPHAMRCSAISRPAAMLSRATECTRGGGSRAGRATMTHGVPPAAILRVLSSVASPAVTIRPRTRCSSIALTCAASRSACWDVLATMTRLPLASATSSIPRIRSR